MLTAWCVFVALGALYAFGLPAAKLLGQDEGEEQWLIAPFLGLAVIVLVLQNLAYIDVRVARAAPWLWVGAGAAWLWMARTGRLTATLLACPRLLMAALAVVFTLHGAGLLLLGAKYYVGRAWHDQFNYTALAQFLLDYPFSLSFADVVNQPYLYKAIQAKTDRIGQSLYHAFVAASTRTDAKTTFEATILLAPALTVPALYAWLRGWAPSRSCAVLVAALSASLPALALVHLESFLSHALAIPLLLVWPSVVGSVAERPQWKRAFCASLILAAGVSIYTELLLVFIGSGAVVMVVEAVRRRQVALVVASFALVVSAAVLLNPGFLGGTLEIIKRIASPGTLRGVYPWAYSVDGLNRLWLGDVAVRGPHWVRSLEAVVSIFLVIGAGAGLLLLSVKRRNGVSVGMLSLATLPLLIRVRGGEYPYQFYKMLLSVSPLLPAGILALTTVLRRCSPGRSEFLRKAGGVVLLVLAALPLAATLEMTWRTGRGRTEEQIGRGGAHKLAAPVTRRVQEMLDGQRNRDVIIAWFDNFFGGNYLNAWLAYFARHNRVWVLNPRLSDVDLTPFTGPTGGIEKAPADALLLLPADMSGRLLAPGARRLWSAGPYALWQLAGRDWAVLAGVRNPNGMEEAGREKWFWVGDREAVITVLVGRSGTVDLAALVSAGPSLPERTAREILVSTDVGHEARGYIVLDREHIPTRWSVPVVAGRNRVAIRGLDRPTVTRLASGDTRTLLFSVGGLTVAGFR